MSIFTTSRSFAASPDRVFAALADPSRLARWWGPDGFRNTFEIFEFRNGGRWHFTMHGPDGTNYANESRFVLIEPNRRAVVQHTSQPHFTLSICIEPDVHGSVVTWEQAFESADVAAAIRHIVEPANEQNLSRWQAELGA
jgi:uncharacterized protein YndB with AHSA1/START domain